jgi:hypothetical protein
MSTRLNFATALFITAGVIMLSAVSYDTASARPKFGTLGYCDWVYDGCAAGCRMNTGLGPPRDRCLNGCFFRRIDCKAKVFSPR